MDGVALRRSIAFWYAIYRVRCTLYRGFRHYDATDLANHVRRIVDDPWLIACTDNTSRRERRAARVTPPPNREQYLRLYSDSASRRLHDDQRLASCGAIVKDRSSVRARAAVFLGDVSNNVAEYRGVILSLEYAVASPSPYLCFRVDSMLIAKQLSGTWTCHSPALVDLYSRALELLSTLRSNDNVLDVLVEHIYREFNADADSLANLGIDGYLPTVHHDGRVLWDNWQ